MDEKDLVGEKYGHVKKEASCHRGLNTKEMASELIWGTTDRLGKYVHRRNYA
jgi:hypothetical protein